MAVRIECVCVDAADPSALAAFWEQVLGWRRSQVEPDEVLIVPPPDSPDEGVVPELLFLRVPEGKTSKNRLHIDLRPTNQAGSSDLRGLGGSSALAAHADVASGDGASVE